MDAFDADVLIYAAVDDHPLGRRIRALFAAESGSKAGVGSVLLLPEILAKPMRDGRAEELTALASLLSRLELLRDVLAAAEAIHDHFARGSLDEDWYMTPSGFALLRSARR